MENSREQEIRTFLERIFKGCKYVASYCPDDKAWRFELSFFTPGTWRISPPKGFCLVGISADKCTVNFTLIVFVESFVQYHLSPVLN